MHLHVYKNMVKASGIQVLGYEIQGPKLRPEF